MFFNVSVSLKMALFGRATSIFIISNRHCSKLISTFRTSLKCSNPPSQFTFCGYFIFRRYSTEPDKKRITTLREFVNFDDFINEKKNQAKRSILVEIQNDRSIPFLHNYCSSFGKIKSIFYYSLADDTHHCLIEFNSEISVKLALESAVHRDYNSVIPVRSTNFYFRRTKATFKSTSGEKLPLILGKPILKMSQLFKQLSEAKTVSEQIENCYSILKLDDIELRLRFQMSQEIERCFLGLFPNVEVLPFGSTVNGFGRMGCDLDMFVTLDRVKKEDSVQRLVFQTKPSELNGKYHQNIKLLETIGEIMKNFVPGVTNVVKILHARVPIIKFNNSYTGIQCDLSLSNMSALYMSELLYLYGEIDRRVRPIIFTLRKWAQVKEITCESPGDHITNFSLTLLILFYLQNKKILPSLQELRKAATKDDKRVTETGVDCTFARNLYSIKIPKTPNVDCFTLLKGFFEFYSTFNYKTHGICLQSGMLTGKDIYIALFIKNPLEPTLNVSRNVSFKQIDRIRYYCREALWLLENETENSSNSEHWGIIGLLKTNQQDKTTTKKTKKSRKGPPNVLEIMKISGSTNDTNFQFAAN
ncbi:poly(A) RNA polymerase, mitochondrial-like [Leptopilina heterotoma]|uniref:poly(A) RNA polymerase, mitochondrial-like n=1 Tax=Leptopilina heterotoma TaxID=63436 RepID=UPI001CAA1081|nr:poly(A) RNA polymerase, mitochondrial-like [Leptopilina heterotoma]